MPLVERTVLTIATGKKFYIDMASNLARSFLYWHPDSDIRFNLITDQKDLIPGDLSGRINIIEIKPGELGIGFSQKLHLDRLAENGQTLFIDSDCLIYGKLEPVFEKFKGNSVSVIGSFISEGEWFGDVAEVCKKFNITQLPKFNGGIYYLESGDTARKVYSTARKLEPQYDDIGFRRLREQPNEEVLMAVSMTLNGQVPIVEDGTILGEFMNFQSGVKSDLLKGSAELYNNPGHKKYQKGWPLTISRPVVVHFLGHHNQLLPYIKEAKHLQYIYGGKWPIWAARLITAIQVTLPFQIVSVIKILFRPLYRSVFGIRKIKRTERMLIND